VPVAVFFDETGSMGSIPMRLQQKLKEFYALIVGKGYAPDAQVLFGAIGDANSDQVSLQIGQFQSDNQMDEDLEAIFLEGNGGGQGHETYELAAYFLARHSVHDSWEKRQRKGYLFTIGDEKYYPQINPQHVEDLIGDTLGEPISTEAIALEVGKLYHWFHIVVPSGSYPPSHSIGAWKKLLGERAIVLEDPEGVCELIALTIGLNEEAIDLDEGIGHLHEMGVATRTIASVTGAAKQLPQSTNTSLAKSSGDLPGLKPPDDSPSTRRL
jgi:hypothetical protein